MNLSGDTTAFGYAAGDRPVADAIGTWHRDSNELQTVARTTYANGTVGGVAFDGETLVYVDMERLASTEGTERTEWRIYAADVESSDSQLVAQSPPGGSLFPPYVHAGDGRFVWTQWEDPNDPWAGRRVRQWRPGDRTPTVVRRATWLNDSAAPVPGGIVFARTHRSQRWPSGMYKTDLYLWPTQAAKPTNISRSGMVLEFDAGDQFLTWTEAHPDTQTSGTRVDPYINLYRPLTSSDEAVEMVRGYNSGNLTGGDGWVSWWTDDLDVQTFDPSSRSSTSLSVGDTFVPARISGDGAKLITARSHGGTVELELYERSLG